MAVDKLILPRGYRHTIMNFMHVFIKSNADFISFLFIFLNHPKYSFLIMKIFEPTNEMRKRLIPVFLYINNTTKCMYTANTCSSHGWLLLYKWLLSVWDLDFAAFILEMYIYGLHMQNMFQLFWCLLLGNGSCHDLW